MIGLVTFFEVIRGFGFIRASELAEDLFFHRSQLMVEGDPWRKTISHGTTVEFEIGKFREKTVAVNIRPLVVAAKGADSEQQQ